MFCCFLCGFEDSKTLKFVEDHLTITDCIEDKLDSLKSCILCGLQSPDRLSKLKVGQTHENVKACLKRKNLKRVSVSLQEIPLLKKNASKLTSLLSSRPSPESSNSSRSSEPLKHRDILKEQLESKSISEESEHEKIELVSDSDHFSKTSVVRLDEDGNENSRPSYHQPRSSPDPGTGPGQAGPFQNAATSLQRIKSRRKGIPHKTDPTKTLSVTNTDYVMKKKKRITNLDGSGLTSAKTTIRPLTSPGNLIRTGLPHPAGQNQVLDIPLNHPEVKSESGVIVNRSEDDPSKGNSGQMVLMSLLHLSKRPMPTRDPEEKTSINVQEFGAKVQGDGTNFLANFESGNLMEDPEPNFKPVQVLDDGENQQQKFKSHSFAEILSPVASMAALRPRRKSTLDRPNGLSSSEHKESRESILKSPMRCRFCAKPFLMEKRLQNHVESKHGAPGEAIQCKQCSFQATDQVSAKQHLQLLHLEPIVLIKSSENFRQLFKLVQASTDEKPISPSQTIPVLRNGSDLTCRFCGKVAKTRARLTNHLKFVHEAAKEPRHVCLDCNISFKTKHILKNHLTFVHSSTRVRCKLCERQYKNVYQYKYHLQNMHSVLIENIKEADIQFETYVPKKAKVRTRIRKMKVGSHDISALAGHRHPKVTPLNLSNADIKPDESHSEQSFFFCATNDQTPSVFWATGLDLTEYLSDFSRETFDEFDDSGDVESDLFGSIKSHDQDRSLSSTEAPVKSGSSPFVVAGDLNEEVAATSSEDQEDLEARDTFERQLIALKATAIDLDDVLEVLRGEVVI